VLMLYDGWAYLMLGLDYLACWLGWDDTFAAVISTDLFVIRAVSDIEA